MTREEAIRGLESLASVRRKYVVMGSMKYEIECLEKAIEALEHEPCEDCISRQEAINSLGEVHPLDYNAQAIKARIEQLPSVQPIRPKGKWVLQRHGLYDDDIHTGCSCCCYTPDRDIHSHIELIHGGGYTQKPYRPNFCPNCGADMRGGEE